MLENATKQTRMVTEYTVNHDGGPHYGRAQTGERIRITRVIVESFDDGYVDISVKGKTVTKDGRDKSASDYFFADNETVETARKELGGVAGSDS